MVQRMYGESVNELLRTEVAEALRSGIPITDAHFDAVYPPFVRIKSSQFWTPVEVALRAAQLLAPEPTARVLDVGSGAGKLCVIGSLVSGAAFTGVEQRPHLVDVARACAARLEAPRASFLHGRFDDVPWHAFDAFYFFNPFAENLFTGFDRLDDTVELSSGRRRSDIERAEELLASLRPGVRVVTYHGYGGELPCEWELRHMEQKRTDYLKMWVKIR